ncbi:MAG: DUF3429 domain-containing protein [Burkholderiaceae bacterium]|nr:DUF3429 domain-containing protein [Burkholderiaceae bacterium]
MSDPHSLHSPPTVPIALWLGYGGLIPFVAGAALVGLLAPESRPVAAAALSAYAAVIVSFLGGIHWGIGFRDGTPRLFLWGVLPSLVAAAALLLPPRHGLTVHAVMLLLCYAVDRRVYPAHGRQAWLRLRWRLSLVAATSCILAAALG